MSRPENDKVANIILRPKAGLTRRDFFIRSAGTALGLYALAHLESNAPAYAQVVGDPPPPPPATSTSRRQLPFWGDVANWNKPEYYETLQMGHRRNGRRRGSIFTNANLFGDDRDCLLIRGPRGILINRFDAATGQWMQDLDGPPLADNMNVYVDQITHIEYKEWNSAPYYSTIMTADIDNDSNAEILARGVNGLQIFKFSADQQQWNKLPVTLPISDAGWAADPYYSTLQCANLGGNIVLTGRAGTGLYAWQFSSDGSSYAQVASLSALSDGNGWGQPQYYSTIFYADLSGAGSDLLIGRGPNGIKVWSYSPNTPPTENFDDVTAQLGSGPAWTDANGWNLPQYYETIQAAYLGLWAPDAQTVKASLVGRGKNGIEVWTIEDSGTWSQASFTTPFMTDAQGWDKPEYYSTIQFADIDGDGIEELLARSVVGLQAWKLKDNGDGTYSWVPLPNGPDWSDANGWNQVQYYSSIQTATVLQSGDPQYSGSATSNAVVIARNSNNVETWYYNPTTQKWSQTSITAFPAFTGAQLTGYNHLTTALGIRGVGEIGIRARYNDETTVIQNWIDDLEGRGTINLQPPPPGVSQADWNTVKEQILTELLWVKEAQNWYGELTHQQIIDTFLGDELTLYTIGPYLNYTSPSNDTTVLALSILALIAGAAAAVMGFPELEIGEAAAITGVIANTFSAAALGMQGQGSSYTAQYDQLQSQLADAFNLALSQLGTQLSQMVGGGTGSAYVPGDYGLLSAIGQMIESTIWNWPTDTTSLTAAMQRGYAIEVWKVLFNALQAKGYDVAWGSWVYNGNPTGLPPSGYPLYAAWYGYDYLAYKKDMWHWLYDGIGGGHYPMPSLDTLQAQFDTPVTGKVFPLGIPTDEFYQAQNGWPILQIHNLGDSATEPGPTPVRPPIAPPKLPSLGVEMDTRIQVTREPSTNEIVVILTHTNRGLTGASNVLVADITLGNQKPVQSPPARHKYIGAGKHYVQTFRFAPQGAGTRAILRANGRYLGGSFGTSMRVVIP